MNKYVAAGNLGKDPELRETKRGTTVAEISLAVNKWVRDGDEKVQKTMWLPVVFFGRVAENVGKVLQEGDAVVIDARLSKRVWETEDGENRSYLEVVGNSFQKMGGSGNGGRRRSSGSRREYDF